MAKTAKSTGVPYTQRRTKASVLVAHELARRAGELEPGDALPPERALIEEMQVGRSTLREALRLLELQGIVTIKAGPGGGPIVARPDHRPLAHTLSLALQTAEVTFQELVEARRVIEGDLANLAAANAGKEDIEALQRSVDHMEAIRADEEAFLDENLNFHEILADAAQNRLLNLFYASLKEISDGHIMGVSYSKGSRAQTVKDHRAIALAVADGDREGAREAMTAHLSEFEAYIRRRYPEVLERRIRWMLDDQLA
jgi:DNA-binding FadR family transcriptional regulator